MAQPPFKSDVIQIEPGAAGTRTIDRDSATGGLRFIDPAFPTGILLSDLAGIQALGDMFVVGQGQYTTIQEAIDATPTNASASNPAVVIIASGSYTENLTISKDGLVLCALGWVRIVNDTADPTVTLIEDTGGVPRFCQFRGITFENTEDGESVVLIDGSNTFADGTVTVNTFPLAAGDTVTIGGTALTGVAGARTSGADDFNASLGSTTALATEIAAAINDLANSFAATVSAAAVGSTVTITAVTPGAGGNAITLATLTVPPGGLSNSGATLTGGGGADSEVGEDGILFLDCNLLATGIGTRQITTDTVNNVRVVGGTWEGSSSTSECVVSQTASFRVEDVARINNIQAAYDTGNDQPAIVTSEFQLVRVGRVGDLLINFIGEGSTRIAHCPVVGDMTHNGDRTLDAISCEFGDLLIEDTVAARLVNCTRGTLGGAGTPTVAESSLTFSSALVAAGSEAVVFTRPQPDTSYAVLVDVPTAGITANVTAKATTGFTATFSAPVTGTVFYTVIRQM